MAIVLANSVTSAAARLRTPRRRLVRLAAAAVLLATWLAMPLAARAAPATQPAPITLTARAGFDGYYKEARWIPMRVTVANDGPDTRGTVRIVTPRYNTAEVIVSREVELPNQSRHEIFLYVPAEGYLSRLEVSLVDGNRELASTSVRLAQTGKADLLYGVLAGSPSAYNLLADVDPVNGSAYVAQLELADLPPVSYAWHSLDVLIVSDVDTGAFSPEQRAALAGWVSAGGRLIVAGGATWQKTAAGLGEVLPLVPSGTTSLAGLDALADYAVAAPPEAGVVVAATGALAPGAAVLASAGDVPLIAARRSGFGQVAFLAVDPAFDPLSGWAGLQGLFRNLLSGTSQRPSWAAGVRNWYSARDAVNALPGLDFPSAFTICGFLGFYLVAVGPVNYLVLRRLKRRELAWVTIPALVLLFSAGAYVAGYQLRGGQASLHRLAVVQVWPDAEFARVEGLIGLFSPRRSEYDLAIGPGFLARPMPVDGFAGPAGSFRLEQADGIIIPGVRLEVGAVEPFVMQGLAPAPSFAADLVLDVGSKFASLQGTVTNRSGLALKDAVVLGPGSAQRLGDLAPGASASIRFPLSNARASVAPLNDVMPAAAAGGPVPPQAFYPPSNNDTTIDDILGNTYYYNDKESFRRYSLLASMIDAYGGSGRGSGVYLIGWTDESPLPVEVVGRPFDTLDRTLYLIALDLRLDVGSGRVVIPPGLMQWLPLNPNPATTPAPYDVYLYQGNEAQLRFIPSQLVPFKTAEGLVMHLTSYGQSGSAALEVALWDFSENNWVDVPAPVWGDNEISRPARFVGPGGEIQVRVANTGALQVSVERLDFTLTAAQ
ncbi:MAG: hypothetical protein IT318_15695 [Anaerolineales bacterium]|nr:hypothetical protein [Anaerolineales bacterium]